jgi:hypothetical protein
MRGTLVMAVILAVAATAAVAAQDSSGDKGDPKGKESRPDDDLPYKGDVKWHGKALEANPDSFTLVKRTVGPKHVTWLLKVNSDAEASRIQQFPLAGTGTYQAQFLDEEGVPVASIELTPHTKDIRVGERVRYSLSLPGRDVVKRSVKVLIKLR